MNHEIAQIRAKMRNRIAAIPHRSELKMIANRLDAALGEALEGVGYYSDIDGVRQNMTKVHARILAALKGEEMPKDEP